jgi:hypothetical protein
MTSDNRDATDHMYEPPPGRCCHYSYVDNPEITPTFDQREEIRDGQRVMVPVLREIQNVPALLDDDVVLATIEFFAPQGCPVCKGSPTCPDCGRRNA